MTSTGITVESLVRRDRVILLSSVGLLAGIAWLAMVRGHADGMTAHHTTAAPLGLTFAVWMVMMVAMMLPPVMPWILLFSAVSRNRAPSAWPFTAVATFAGGYFTVWAVYSLAAASLQLVLQRHALLSAVDLGVGPYAGGALLLLAGLFQVSPLKAACLRHCRSPLGFFLTRWREGPIGAYRMGLQHGAYCVGCCWALMMLSFALGVMNLLWMTALTLFLCLEKIAPGGGTSSRLSGLVFMAWGLWMLIGSDLL